MGRWHRGRNRQRILQQVRAVAQWPEIVPLIGSPIDGTKTHGEPKMKDQNTAPTPPIDAINRAAERAYALRLPARWMAGTAVPWIIITLATPIFQLLAEAFLGRPIDHAVAFLYELPLMIPFLSVGIWWLVERSHLRKAFRELHGIFVPGHNAAWQIVPPLAIGPLLEATLAEATLISVWENDDIASVTELLGALLESIQVEDEAVLTEFQRKRLHELVMPGCWYDTGGVGGKNTVVLNTLRGKLRPAGIGALAVLGDSSSILVLERFARKTDDPDLRQTVLQSIEQIRERLQYGPAEMLRASRAPERPDTLLRAALPDKPHDHDPQELLRPDNAAEFQNTSALQQVHEPTMSVSTRARD